MRTSVFTAALFTRAKLWKQPEWASAGNDKDNVGYIYHGNYLAIKKKSCHL